MAVEDTLDRIIAKNKERNAQRSSQVTELQRHGEIIDMGLQQQETLVKVVRSLVSFLERHTGKTEVVNQLESIGTPDAMKVVDAVESLHTTLKTHENTDLSEITEVMKQVLAQLEQVPKDYQEITIPETVKVSNMPDHSKDMKALLEAVKAIKLVAEAPQVTVEPTPVQVDTDVSPVTKAVEKATKAIKDIVIPQTDLSDLEKLVKKSNKLLSGILDKPVGGGGGGGGGRVSPYQVGEQPAFVDLESDGSLPVTVKGGISGGSDASLSEQQAQTVILDLIRQNTDALQAIAVVVKSLQQAQVDPSYLDKSANAIRNQVQSGTITTVSTVTSVSALTNVDSYQGKLLMVGQDIAAWAGVVRERIT